MFLSSTNRKQNRIGFLLLKSLILTDIQEHTGNPASSRLLLPLQQFQWKEGVCRGDVGQREGNEWIHMDAIHCVLERYFFDIQNVCISFYESEDIVTRVSVHSFFMSRTAPAKSWLPSTSSS